jgi:simple sugar transport system ATP-binding protein
MRNISKSFGDVKANEDVHLAVRKGSIHCLIGENGAGKSTLMSILYGIIQPDAGEIYVNGRRCVIRNPREANALGIGMVHQHFQLVDSFTVAENVVFGKEPRKGWLTDRRKAAEITRKLSEEYGLKVDPAAKIADLPVGIRQRVELLKALHKGSDILILDEPTAVLTPQETKELFATLRNLVAGGKTVILITHKMEEVMSVSDRVTVLRRGKTVGTMERSECDEHKLSLMMVGRQVEAHLPKPEMPQGKAVLEVSGVKVGGAQGTLSVRGVSFTVREGEIVTIAGVEGNGQSELVEALTGLRPVLEGRVSVGGRDVTNQSPAAIRRAGLAHVPSDRIAMGLSVGQSLEENAVAGHHRMRPFRRGWLMNHREIRKFTESLIGQFDVRCGGSSVAAGTLSGGNMQKLVIAREMSYGARFLLASLPTRGIDIGASELVHKHLIEARNAGTGILVVSTDLDEVFRISDRILVMYNGEVVGEFRADATTREELGLYMIGARRQQEAIAGGEAI